MLQRAAVHVGGGAAGDADNACPYVLPSKRSSRRTVASVSSLSTPAAASPNGVFPPTVGRGGGMAAATGLRGGKGNTRSKSAVYEAIIYPATEELVTIPTGELECVASGFVSIHDYLLVGEELSELFVAVMEKRLEMAPHRGSELEKTSQTITPLPSPPPPPPADPALASKSSSTSVSLNPSSASGTPVTKEAISNLSWLQLREIMLTNKMTLLQPGASGVVASSSMGAPSMVSATPLVNHSNNASFATVQGTQSGPRTPGPQMLGDVEGFLEGDDASMGIFSTRSRSLSLMDLGVITSKDAVTELYLSRAGKRVRGMASVVRSTSPQTALWFFIRAAMMRAAAQRQAHFSPEAMHGKAVAKGNRESDPMELPPGVSLELPETQAQTPEDKGWVLSGRVILRSLTAEEERAAQHVKDSFAAVGDEVVLMLKETAHLTYSYFKVLSETLPLDINSRFNSNYLLPTVPVVAPFVGCGLHTRRSKEFFVSMKDRISILEHCNSFTSPETMLLAISQLSNLASHMMSSFALGAVLACTRRWRELLENSATFPDHTDIEMEKFATIYCGVYDLQSERSFPALRKQFPNVFIASSYCIKEEEGGRPPILTVLMSILLKLLFLFSGGLESIRADDRRTAAHALKKEHLRRTKQGERPLEASILQPSTMGTSMALSESNTLRSGGRAGGEGRALTDDIALAAALHIRSVTQIVYAGALFMDGPLSVDCTFKESLQIARGCAKVWRVLFQVAGLLPFGLSCPAEMKEWLPLFPFYSISDGSKRIMLRVYSKVAVTQVPLPLSPICHENALSSTMALIHKVVMERETREAASSTVTTISPMALRSPVSTSSPSFTSLAKPSTAAEMAAAAATAGVTPTSSSPPIVSPNGESLVVGSSGVVRQPLGQPEEDAQQAKSFQLLPQFTGVRLTNESRNKAMSIRSRCAELYELCMVQSVSTHLPGISITNEVYVNPLVGGLRTFRAEKLRNPAFLTKNTLKQYKHNLSLVITWRRSTRGLQSVSVSLPSTTTTAESTECRIQNGDELTIRWADGATHPKTKHTATQSFIAAASVARQNAEILSTGGSSATLTSNARGDALVPPLQRHRVLLILPTTQPNQQVVVLDSINVLSKWSSVVNRRDSTAADGSRATAAQPPYVSGLLYHRRQQPPFRMAGDGVCAWTNPQFLLHQEKPPEQVTPRPHLHAPPATEAEMPLALGWLMGQAFGNIEIFHLPVAPLMFRLLSLAVQLEQPIEAVTLTAADISLLDHDFPNSEVSRRILANVNTLLEARQGLDGETGFNANLSMAGPTVLAKRQLQRLKKDLNAILMSFLWNIQDSTAASRAFWSSFMRGIRHTPIMGTPIFAQCCARTLHDVLCGPFDSMQKDFSITDSFLISTEWDGPHGMYRRQIRKVILDTLDGLSMLEKRSLLLLLTGHRLRSAEAQLESLFFVINSSITDPSTILQQRSSDEKQTREELWRDCIDITLRRLPEAHRGEKTLCIPNYFEALLLGSYRTRILGLPPFPLQWTNEDEADLGAPLHMEKEAFAEAWTALNMSQQEMVLREFHQVLRLRLRMALRDFLRTQHDCIDAAWQVDAQIAEDTLSGNIHVCNVASPNWSHQRSNRASVASLLNASGSIDLFDENFDYKEEDMGDDGENDDSKTFGSDQTRQPSDTSLVNSAALGGSEASDEAVPGTDEDEEFSDEMDASLHGYRTAASFRFSISLSEDLERNHELAVRAAGAEGKDAESSKAKGDNGPAEYRMARVNRRSVAMMMSATADVKPEKKDGRRVSKVEGISHLLHRINSNANNATSSSRQSSQHRRDSKRNSRLDSATALAAAAAAAAARNGSSDNETQASAAAEVDQAIAELFPNGSEM